MEKIFKSFDVDGKSATIPMEALGQLLKALCLPMTKKETLKVLNILKSPVRPGDVNNGKYSKRCRSNVAVIIVKIVFISSFRGSFLFYCLLLNHSFPTNPNSITNCIETYSLLFYKLYQTTFAQCVSSIF